MYAKVGRQSNASGAVHVFRGDADGNQIVQAVGPEYADLVKAGRVFAVSNQAGKTTTAALATTWTGLGIGNPTASPVNLVMLGFSVAQLAAGAAGGIGLMCADMTGLATELTPVNQLRGSTQSSSAVADTAATIGTPILHRVFGSIGSVATTGYGLVQGLNVDLKGSLILKPGYSVLSYTTAVTTSALIFTFVWAEETI